MHFHKYYSLQVTTICLLVMMLNMC